MPIYKIEKTKTRQLKISHFRNEKELQGLVEANLEELFGIKFVASEYSTGERHGGRIDTLGLDENNSPVIIEYKWGEEENIINQGLFYLDWLVDHKGDFEKIVREKLASLYDSPIATYDGEIKEPKIDWGQPRLILIASSFTKYDKYAINRMPENMELWSYTRYENDILSLSLEAASQTTKRVGRKVTGVKYEDYDLNYHLGKTNETLRRIFGDLREKILELPGVEERAQQKSGVTYRTAKSFVRFEFGNSYIDILLREDVVAADSEKLAQDISSYGWGYPRRAKIRGKEDIDYVFRLIRKSYESTL